MTKKIDLFINIAKLSYILSKTLDGKLGGIGFNDFIVLYHLNKAPENKLRRIDLAEMVGLSASGVTRLLLPMEKIGLVNKESNPNDARVSYVILAPGGKTKFTEALERFEIFNEEVISSDSNEKVLATKLFIDEIVEKIKM
ncbi:MAG: MarR family winged helix-turn-helix transcriptional regulator [Candidatus Gracilibacteria bacterium]|nr:MarR family winged helix-turn-helix transcriptional regulator [Candidatus Gracilibacteria bacterium]